MLEDEVSTFYIGFKQQVRQFVDSLTFISR